MDLDSLPELLTGLSDTELGVFFQAVQGEWHRRALLQGDLDALCEEGFSRGFDTRGLALDPFVVGNIIVCPGGKVAKSAMSHQCRFVAIGESWVWDYEMTLHDKIRYGDRHSMQSISLVAYQEGLNLDVVTSKARGGAHERQGTVRYTAEHGELVNRGTVTVAVRDHR